MRFKNVIIGAIVLAVVVVGVLLFGVGSHNRLLAKETPGYQAVLLDNNQVYYGRLSDLGTDYPVLTNVFYVQTVVNPQTKQTSNVLLKRGKEWHAPDKMLIDARHIVMIEPVTPGSTVAKLIDEAMRGK
jgi:hypothetical protein